jgi:hypothetical protein
MVLVLKCVVVTAHALHQKISALVRMDGEVSGVQPVGVSLMIHFVSPRAALMSAREVDVAFVAFATANLVSVD